MDEPVKKGNRLVSDSFEQKSSALNCLLRAHTRRVRIRVKLRIITREYGIPCLVGTSGATAQIKTGTSIHLDTYSGRVYIK